VPTTPATSCLEAFKAVGVAELAKPQQIAWYTGFGNNTGVGNYTSTFCALAQCPPGGHLTGTSISAWPPARVVPVVTYTDADGIMAARPNEEGCQATRVMGMWQLYTYPTGTTSIAAVNNGTDVYSYTLSASCAVCDDHHDRHFDSEAAQN
jgi:hypothetical protein